MDRARIVHVEIEATPQGLLRATSPQERGLHAAGRTLDGVRSAVGAMLRDLYSARGHNVSVIEADTGDEAVSWVVIPNQPALG